MIKELSAIQAHLINLLKEQGGVFKVTQDSPETFEVSGTVEAMQGKKKVDGIYFASVVPKPKNVRFYFFPLFTHGEALQDVLTEELKKALKGKTCFHIKSISESMVGDLDNLISASVKLYQQDGLLASE